MSPHSSDARSRWSAPAGSCCRSNDLYQRAAGTNSRVVLESSITLAVLIAVAVITFLFLFGDSGTHLGPCSEAAA